MGRDMKMHIEKSTFENFEECVLKDMHVNI